MGYKITPPITVPGLGGWTYQGDVSLGDPPAGGFYVDQTSMSSGAPTIELNVTDDNGIDHSDWLQDLVNTNHLVLRNRAFPADALVFELSSNTPGAGFRTLVGDIRSGSGTFRIGSTYDLWSITTSENFVVGPASSVATSVPTFSDTTGKLVQNNTTLQYDTGEVQLAAAATAVEIQERNTPPADAVGKGHVWVRDDVPNTLVFTDDTGVDHAFFDFVTGPASSTPDAIPTFLDTTGKELQDTVTLQYDTGELQLQHSPAALEIEERNLAPADAVGKGHVWVKDDAPNILTFTDDIGVDHPIVPPNTVVLGEWTFGSAVLGITAGGEFETNNANILLITAIRFNAIPNSGQSAVSWADLLPQEGILYLQDISDPGVNNVTFPYLSITFPIGGGWPQFNGNILVTNGTNHGTNWSANDYSLQIVDVAPSLDRVINAYAADNDVIVPSADPIILRDPGSNITTLQVSADNAAAAESALEIQRDANADVGLRFETESFIPDDYVARWDSTTSDGMTFTTSEVVGDIATWLDEKSLWTFSTVLTNEPVWNAGEVYFDGTMGLRTDGFYAAEDATWILCASFDGVSSHDYMMGTPNEVFVGNQGITDEKIEFVMNTGGSPIYKSATDLTDETVVLTVTNKHNATDDNDKEAWLGTTYLGGEFGQTDALSDKNFIDLGFAVSSGQATIGYMYELIVYDRTLSHEEIANVTNELSIKWSAQTGDGLSVSSSTLATSLNLSATGIVPGAKILADPFSIKPETTSYASAGGVDYWFLAGDHTGSLRGGNLVLDAGASTSGTNGIVIIGEVAREIQFGHSVTPGVTITEGTDHPVAPAATKAQVWVKSDYGVPTTPTGEVKDGQALMVTTDTGLDINLSWLAANYKPRLGGYLALGHLEEGVGFAGGTSKVLADASVSYCYDWLSNMWYQSWIDAGTLDAQVTSSDDGGYTWVTAKEVDTGINAGDLSPPCTNGTNLGIGADGRFFLSTTLSATNLPSAGAPTGTAGTMNGSTGLVWSVQASLWVMCGDDGTDGLVYTSPDGITWTNRSPTAFASSVRPVSMDIAHVGFGGYNGTERIIMTCGTTSTSVFYSTNGGVTWGEDTIGVPTVGCEFVMWAPSIGNSTTEPGCWMALEDASGDLWLSDGVFGGAWQDTTATANSVFRTEEWAGYLNNSTNATWYQLTSNVPGFGGHSNQTMGVTYSNMRPMFVSRTATKNARYQWGNGVVMWDRVGDGELMIGRYGPIEPV
jgi:hypothetical protein